MGLTVTNLYWFRWSKTRPGWTWVRRNTYIRADGVENYLWQRNLARVALAWAGFLASCFIVGATIGFLLVG